MIDRDGVEGNCDLYFETPGTVHEAFGVWLWSKSNLALAHPYLKCGLQRLLTLSRHGALSRFESIRGFDPPDLRNVDPTFRHFAYSQTTKYHVMLKRDVCLYALYPTLFEDFIN